MVKVKSENRISKNLISNIPITHLSIGNFTFIRVWTLQTFLGRTFGLDESATKKRKKKGKNLFLFWKLRNVKNTLVGANDTLKFYMFGN